MNAFDLHEEFLRYQREGGIRHFDQWADRYGEDYGCDGAWLAADYLSAWRHHEDEHPDLTMPPFREWLAAQPLAYLKAHLDEVPEIPNQGRGVDLDRTEGEVGPIVAVADAGAGGHHADSRAAGVPDDGPVGHDHGGAASELEPAREGDRPSVRPATDPDDELERLRAENTKLAIDLSIAEFRATIAENNLRWAEDWLRPELWEVARG